MCHLSRNASEGCKLGTYPEIKGPTTGPINGDLQNGRVDPKYNLVKGYAYMVYTAIGLGT
jgi:hypothetical protein